MSGNRSPAASSRRSFLEFTAAAITGVMLAPGVRLIELARARPAGDPASSTLRWGMLIDTARCDSGCSDCVAACNVEHGLSGRTGETDSQWIRKIELKAAGSGWAASLPMMCQHCAQAPCVDVCPTGASFKRADGIVLVNQHTCIGCRYCIMACPYGARSFVHEPLTGQKPDVPRGKGCVESCTLCVQRVDRELDPACAVACAAAGHGAILFGDLNNPDSEISRRVAAIASRQVREDLNLDTGVRYQGL